MRWADPGQLALWVYHFERLIRDQMLASCCFPSLQHAQSAEGYTHPASFNAQILVWRSEFLLGQNVGIFQGLCPSNTLVSCRLKEWLVGGIIPTIIHSGCRVISFSFNSLEPHFTFD